MNDQAALDRLRDQFAEFILNRHGPGDAFDQWFDAFTFAFDHPDSTQATAIAAQALDLLQCSTTTTPHVSA